MKSIIKVLAFLSLGAIAAGAADLDDSDLVQEIVDKVQGNKRMLLAVNEPIDGGETVVRMLQVVEMEPDDEEPEDEDDRELAIDEDEPDGEEISHLRTNRNLKHYKKKWGWKKKYYKKKGWKKGWKKYRELEVDEEPEEEVQHSRNLKKHYWKKKWGGKKKYYKKKGWKKGWKKGKW